MSSENPPHILRILRKSIRNMRKPAAPERSLSRECLTGGNAPVRLAFSPSRNHMVPVPEVANWEALDQFLLAGSRQDEQRWIGDRSQTGGAGINREREHLRALAKEGFDLAGVHYPQVNASSCVRVLTNFYSTPLPVG